MSLVAVVSPAERSMRALSDYARAVCPAEVMTLDLSHRDVLEALIGKRYLCGDDGTVLPTRQGLCPSCAGHVEPFDAHRRDVVGRLWSELQAM